MRPLLFLFLIFLFSLSCTLCFAAEIDSITPRNILLKDSVSDINSIFNARIQEGVDRANKRRSDYAYMDKDEFCDEELLLNEVRKAIFQSYGVSLGLKGYNLDKQLRELLFEKSYSLALEKSIYRDITYYEGISLNLKELSDVVSIDNHYIGIDKFGHFFAEGYHYFKLIQLKNKSLDEAMAWGKRQEEGKFGYLTTGIFSFADLAANLNGYRFWNKLLLKKKDPLKGPISSLFDSPYITCDIQILDSLRYGKFIKIWRYKERFDILDYLDGSWDEGNNCNSYEDEAIEQKVFSRIKEVDSNFSFPAQKEQCQKAKRKYGKYAEEMLHPRCLSIR